MQIEPPLVITQHIWKGSLVAVTTRDSHQVFVFEVPTDFDPFLSICASPQITEWYCKYTISNPEEKPIIGMDWSTKNELITCYQDFSVHLWKLEGEFSMPEYSRKAALVLPIENESEIGEFIWKPYLIIPRIDSPSTCCKFSYSGNKFAIGTVSKVVSICNYCNESGFHFSKLLKKHSSCIKSLAWHPNNLLLATGGTDCKLFIVSHPYNEDSTLDLRFGQVFLRSDLDGIINYLEFSTDGHWIVALCQNSKVYFHNFTMDSLDPSFEHLSATKQTILHDGLPFTCGLFLSDCLFVAAGHDSSPYLFKLEHSQWKSQGKLENDNDEIGFHTQPIHSIQLVKTDSSKNGMKIFSTCSNDGKILLWRVLL